ARGQARRSQFHLDGRPTCCARDDAEVAADGGRPLAHRDEPETGRTVDFGVETDAVILDAEPRSFAVRELHPYDVGLRVPGGVGHGLANDPKELLLFAKADAVGLLGVDLHSRAETPAELLAGVGGGS